jgi:CDK-activating kinase assembly factor MAT1
LVDKEIEIRRRVLRDFNKTEEDFSTLREFSDYQEMIEDIIYNLTNNIDVQETNRQIADYKEANKNFISKNRQKQSRELLELEDILSEEKKQSLARKQLDLRLDLVMDLSMGENFGMGILIKNYFPN